MHQSLPAGIRLGQEIGRGGFGLVNLATQQVFDRHVAVKRLISADAEQARRFYAEAVITANLQHPNIGPILDLMQDAEGRLQLVMKVIDGVSWLDLLAPRKPEHQARAAAMTCDDHLDILIKVCDAVSFAHDRGILHRDLKPGNVMVGTFGEVQVMDWGCAVAFGGLKPHEAFPTLERIDQIAGTPSYMPPESVLRRVEAIGPHTDVYLLGGMLYHILTGTAPHRGEDVHTTLCAAAVSIIDAPHDRAPERDIPDELAWIAMAALVRDPGERTRTVGAFERQLKDYRAHAQAMHLAGAAAQGIAEARQDPAHAEELLRRAMAAADNAVELWPERTAGLKVQLEATLACMDLALAHSDLGAAGSAAARAKTMARALRADDQVMRATDGLAAVRAAAAAQSSRIRHVRLLRLSLSAAVLVVIAGLVVGLALLSAQQRRTQQALRDAQSAAEQRDAAQARRLADLRGTAPGLVAEARQLVAAKRMDEAERIAAFAATFDGDLADAHALLACLRAARGNYEGARVEAEAWSRTSSGDAHAGELIALLDRARALGETMPPDLATGLRRVLRRGAPWGSSRRAAC